MCIEYAKPFLKWAGGKGQLLNTFHTIFPKELKEGKIKVYIEPFVGGGAVLFHILQNFKIEKAYINDINRELINCYSCIKEDVYCVIQKLDDMQKEYLSSKNREYYFYKIRDRYNESNLEQNIDFDKCADFIFLNKTCFNGLYRVNKSAKFNVPHGKYQNPLICDKTNLQACAKLLQKVIISYGSYMYTIDKVDKNTFIYFDPPYRPLIENISFVGYDKLGFNDKDQIELAKFYKYLNEKESLLMLSNSDPKNIDKDDNFFDSLYNDFNIKRVQAKRMINCQASKRGNINEIVVTNY